MRRSRLPDVLLADTFKAILARGVSAEYPAPNQKERGYLMETATEYTAVVPWARSRGEPAIAAAEMVAGLRRRLACRDRDIRGYRTMMEEASRLRDRWRAEGRPGLAAARRIIREYVTGLDIRVPA